MDIGRLSAEEVERILAPKPTEIFLINEATVDDVFRTMRQFFDVTYYGKPHGLQFQVYRVVAREQHTALPPQPPAHAPEPDDPTGAKVTAAREAVAALWPKGIPTGLMAKDRENAIMTWCEENNRSVPSPRTIRDAIKGKAA